MRQTIRLTAVEHWRRNSFNVGEQICKDIKVSTTNFMPEEIERMGELCLAKKKIILGRVGNVWKISRDTDRAKDNFRPHFVIEGRVITVLRVRHQKELPVIGENNRLITQLSHGDLFRSFQSPRTNGECRRNKKSRGPHCRLGDKLQYEKKFYGVK